MNSELNSDLKGEVEQGKLRLGIEDNVGQGSFGSDSKQIAIEPVVPRAVNGDWVKDEGTDYGEK